MLISLHHHPPKPHHIFISKEMPTTNSLCHPPAWVASWGKISSDTRRQDVCWRPSGLPVVSLERERRDGDQKNFKKETLHAVQYSLFPPSHHRRQWCSASIIQCVISAGEGSALILFYFIFCTRHVRRRHAEETFNESELRDKPV